MGVKTRREGMAQVFDSDTQTNKQETMIKDLATEEETDLQDCVAAEPQTLEGQI